MNNEILTRVNELRAEGKSDDAIRLEMQTKGLPFADVERALAAHVEPAQSQAAAVPIAVPPPADKKKGKYLLIAVGVLVLVAAVLAAFKFKSVLFSSQLSKGDVQKEAAHRNPMSRYTDERQGWEMDYPPLFKPTESGQGGVDVLLATEKFDSPVPVGEAAVFVTFAIGEASDAQTALDNMLKSVDELNKKSSNPLTVVATPISKVRVGNYDALKYEFDLSTAKPAKGYAVGHNVQYMVQSPIIPHAVYTIQLYTGKKDPAIEAQFEKMVESFRMTEAAGVRYEGQVVATYPRTWTADNPTLRKQNNKSIAVFNSPSTKEGLVDIVVITKIPFVANYDLKKYSELMTAKYAKDPDIKVLSTTTTKLKDREAPTLTLEQNIRKVAVVSEQSYAGEGRDLYVITRTHLKGYSEWDGEVKKLYESLYFGHDGGGAALDFSGWKLYSNKAAGFSVSYPGNEPQMQSATGTISRLLFEFNFPDNAPSAPYNAFIRVTKWDAASCKSFQAETGTKVVYHATPYKKQTFDFDYMTGKMALSQAYTGEPQKGTGQCFTVRIQATPAKIDDDARARFNGIVDEVMGSLKPI